MDNYFTQFNKHNVSISYNPNMILIHNLRVIRPIHYRCTIKIYITQTSSVNSRHTSSKRRGNQH